jgi:hypothetical protein
MEDPADRGWISVCGAEPERGLGELTEAQRATRHAAVSETRFRMRPNSGNMGFSLPEITIFSKPLGGYQEQLTRMGRFLWRGTSKLDIYCKGRTLQFFAYDAAFSKKMAAWRARSL